jgi:hypothetical protein
VNNANIDTHAEVTSTFVRNDDGVLVYSAPANAVYRIKDRSTTAVVTTLVDGGTSLTPTATLTAVSYAAAAPDTIYFAAVYNATTASVGIFSVDLAGASAT